MVLFNNFAVNCFKMHPLNKKNNTFNYILSALILTSSRIGISELTSHETPTITNKHETIRNRIWRVLTVHKQSSGKLISRTVCESLPFEPLFSQMCTQGLRLERSQLVISGLIKQPTKWLIITKVCRLTRIKTVWGQVAPSASRCFAANQGPWQL